jgi:uncharacterized protein (DUF58 family)
VTPSAAPGPLGERFDPRTLAALSGLDLKARYVMEGFLAGLHRSPFHGFSVEFSDYRNYQRGDDPRHVDWRLYARSDRLCVKRFTQETNARFYLVVDTSASMGYRGGKAWGSKLDAARLLAAALAWLLLKQNDAVGLIAPGNDPSTPLFVRPSQRPNQLGLLLRELEGLRPLGGPALVALLSQAARLVHRRSFIVLLSDLLEESEETSALLKQLRFFAHEQLVLQVLDGDEIDFPFTEARVFEDLETGARRAVAPREARERYLRRFAAFMASWKDLLDAV